MCSNYYEVLIYISFILCHLWLLWTNLTYFFGLLLYNISIQQQVFSFFTTESRKRAVRRGEKVMLTNATSQNNFHQLFNFHAMYVHTSTWRVKLLFTHTYSLRIQSYLWFYPFHTHKGLSVFLYSSKYFKKWVWDL